jgi:ribosomal-protein-alanine N-acetyltransferase
MAEIEIATDRLRLWQPGPDDAAHVKRFYDANQAHLEPWSPPNPPGWGTLEYWALRLSEQEDRFAISWKDDGTRVVIGRIGLSELQRGPLQQANLGYALDAGVQGRGVMTEAVESVCRYAFDVLRLHRLSANYMPTNERSAQVLRRCGFVPCGYARDYLFIDGAWRDHVLTQRTDREGRPPP